MIIYICIYTHTHIYIDRYMNRYMSVLQILMSIFKLNPPFFLLALEISSISPVDVEAKIQQLASGAVEVSDEWFQLRAVRRGFR